MENASKALMMAGGVLIAIITISVFYYMFSQISTFRKNVDDNPTEAALLDFNQGFESYNRKVMYGADVISVLNKAIDNNRAYDVETDYEGPYYMDIVFVLKNNLETRVETFTLNSTGVGYDRTKTDNVDTVFEANKEYSLKNDGEKIKTLIIDGLSWTDEDDKIYNNQDSSVSTYTPGCKTYTVTYYPAAEFKRRVFYCQGVKYDEGGTGRITQMTFVEK